MRAYLSLALSMFAAIGALSNSSIAFADENEMIGRAFSSNLASHLSQAQTFKNLPAVLGLKSEDTRALESDIQVHGLKDKPLPVFTVEGAALKFDGLEKPVNLDFRELTSSKLYFNQKVIDLSHPISYARAKILVDQLMGEKSNHAFLNLTLPQAQAQSAAKRDLSTFFASLFDLSSHYPTDLEAAKIPRNNLEAAMIRGYEEEARMYKSQESYEGTPQLQAETFTCNGSQLISVQKVGLLSESHYKVNNEDMNQMTWDQQKKQWNFHVHHFECDSKASLNGKVVAGGGHDCPKNGDNIYSQQPFYDFPEVAMACCQKPGCDQAVHAALYHIVELQKNHQPIPVHTGQ